MPSHKTSTRKTLPSNNTMNKKTGKDFTQVRINETLHNNGYKHYKSKSNDKYKITKNNKTIYKGTITRAGYPLGIGTFYYKNGNFRINNIKSVRGSSGTIYRKASIKLNSNITFFKNKEVFSCTFKKISEKGILFYRN